MNNFDPALAGACDSVSRLHTLEHAGLGRYGHRLDSSGFLKAFQALSTLLCLGGMLYVSVSIARQRIEFNAHRVFSLNYVCEIRRCGSAYRVERFSYVDDAADLHENARLDSPETQRNFDCHYGLAILELVKKPHRIVISQQRSMLTQSPMCSPGSRAE